MDAVYEKSGAASRDNERNGSYIWRNGAMNKVELLAEKILINAAKSNDGSCYPSQISSGKTEVYNALELLEMYGKTYPTAGGAMPIFTINELGKHFASTGAWSEKEKRENLQEERYNTSNQLIKLSIAVTVVIGIATIIVSIFF